MGITIDDAIKKLSQSAVVIEKRKPRLEETWRGETNERRENQD